MNAITRCPFPPSWMPDEIAGAAASPRTAGLDALFACSPGDGAPGHPKARPLHAGYLAQAGLSARFRIHG